MLSLLAAVVVVFVATVLISGTPEYLIPMAILLVLILAYAGLNLALTRRELARHADDPMNALRDDEDWAIPSAHLIGDDDTAAGDTPEVHNEINPHDLPIDHPGRPAAERQAALAETETTTGNEEGGAGGDFSGGKDETEERTGERQTSSPYAKSAGGSGTPGTTARQGDIDTSEDGSR
jgi:hypothetical protein